MINTMVPSHLSVFVCYAHKDNESQDPSNRWLDRLLEQLVPLEIQDKVYTWSDKDIETGQDWQDRIQQKLETTKVAVLLVSPAFLASTYIRNTELPLLLKRDIIILPVILRYCSIEETIFKYPDPVNGPKNFSISSLQSANSPTAPMNSLSEHEQDKVLLEVAQRLVKILKQSDSPQTTTGNLPKPTRNHPPQKKFVYRGRGNNFRKFRKTSVPISTKRKCMCPCGFVFTVDHHRSASFFGVVYKDSQKNHLKTTNCPKCGRKLSLNIQGFYPLSLKK